MACEPLCKVVKSRWCPIYAGGGGVAGVGAAFCPCTGLPHYVLAAAVSAIVSFVGKAIWPDQGLCCRPDRPEPASPAGDRRQSRSPRQPPRAGAEAKRRLHRRSGAGRAHRTNGTGPSPRCAGSTTPSRTRLSPPRSTTWRTITGKIIDLRGGAPSEAAPDPPIPELLSAHHPQAPQRL